MGIFVVNSNLSSFRKKPLVSVIVPNYNYERYLGQCLNSIIQQDYPNIEIIVIDDGSTDGSVQLVERYAPKVILVQQKNQGVSSARNTGLIKSRGEYLAFIDADDFWDARKISKQMEFLLEVGADLVYSGVHIVSPDGSEIINTILPKYDLDCSARYRQYPSSAIILLGTSNALFKKSVISKSGIFDVRLSQSSDWDFFRRFTDHGKVCKLEEPLTYYREHSENMTSNSEVFCYDTMRCVSKMNLDDKKDSPIYKRAKVRSAAYFLLLKYLISKAIK